MQNDRPSLALVTGAGHRLGRIFALSLAKQGYAILLHYHLSEEKARVTAEEIRLLGVPCHLHQADLTKPEQVQSLFTSIDHLAYPLSVFVNSAALMRHSDIRSLTPEEWDIELDLNLRAPFFLAQAAAARMQAGGLIINVSDAGAGHAWTGFPAYSISKTGLEQLTRLLAKALAPKIRVNAIAPGLVFPAEEMPSEAWKKMVDRLPLKHPQTEADLEAAVKFLLDAKSVTGQTVVIDGGYSLL
jgi:NAD(P)-dependent dehydrogenase (short-subunit alcohol dehydrogenase family)